MAALPSNQKVGKASLGLPKGQVYSKNANIPNVKSHLHLHNVKTWITETAKDHLLEDIPQELIDELITDAINDSVL